MSVETGSYDRFEIQESDPYVEFSYDNEEDAQEAIEEYQERKGNSVLSARYLSIGMGLPSGELTPSIHPDNPEKVLVSEQNSEEFKRISEEVLEQ